MLSNKLIDLKCKACSKNTPKLNNEEIEINLKIIDSWNINEDRSMIFKKVKFDTFKKSLKFVNLIGEIAEKEKHHPDISFGYGYCLILIHTHAINALSINDFILAAKIDNFLKYKNIS